MGQGEISKVTRNLLRGVVLDVPERTVSTSGRETSV